MLAKHGDCDTDRLCSFPQRGFGFIRDPVTMLAVSWLTLTMSWQVE